MQIKKGNMDHGENSRCDLKCWVWIRLKNLLSHLNMLKTERWKGEKFSRAVDYFLFTKIVVAIDGDSENLHANVQSVLLTVIYNRRKKHPLESNQSPKAVSEVGDCLVTFCTASMHCPGYL